MKAAVLQAPGKIKVEERHRPEQVAPGWVRVQVDAVGICGSDVHYFTHGRIGDFVVRGPLILGHETAGTVTETGAGVEGIVAGDRVALEPGIPCGSCRQCRTGRYNLCASIRFFATPPDDGSLVEEVVHPAAFCYRLPGELTLQEGALAEPMSVGIQAVRRAEVSLGDAVLVTGCGPIGLMAGLAARAAGGRAVLTDVRPERRAVARQMGFEVMSAQELTADRGGWDRLIECSGSTAATETGLAKIGAAAIAVLVGMHVEPRVELPVFDILTREIDLRGVFRYRNTYGAALSVLVREKGRLAPLLGRVEPLDRSQAVFEELAAGRGEALKVFISPSGEL